MELTTIVKDLITINDAEAAGDFQIPVENSESDSE